MGDRIKSTTPSVSMELRLAWANQIGDEALEFAKGCKSQGARALSEVECEIYAEGARCGARKIFNTLILHGLIEVK